ncbi:GlcG/HbpS family heme-binding protein [Rosenbergiella epipactidis]|uniref:GlcG/HbpS family heme-binding protein n=1 Tax=Rosenbergiella epipactidis TaxID=1544694 RepID=UPI001F4FDEBF|nr:heme-binding protein [Rosenbergiella epipactidis]
MSLFTTSSSINADLARKLIAAGEAKLHEMGLASNIAIVDAQGFLIAYLRMDGAPLPSIEHSINKGYTSALFSASSASLGKDAQPGGSLYGLNITLNQRVIVFAGGEPLIHDEQVVGAVGISGGTAEQDQQVADHVVKAFKSLSAA